LISATMVSISARIESDLRLYRAARNAPLPNQYNPPVPVRTAASGETDSGPPLADSAPMTE
jgi:hypothetical protein